jgi:hypothetical protein
MGQMRHDDVLRQEYDLWQLKRGVRGKYLKRYRAGTKFALLAPDVRAAFPTDEAVNQALRSLMQAHGPASMTGLSEESAAREPRP